MHGVSSRANLRMPFEGFDQHVMSSYGAQLRNARQDDSFFLNHDYGEVNDSSVVDVLKTVWRGMSPANTECVMDHLEVIIRIYDLISGAKP
jgi:hypothetical protein